MDVVRFNFPTTVKVGRGVTRLLPEILQPYKRPLVITDRSVAKLPFFNQLLDHLRSRFEVATFSDFAGNPLKQHVDDGVEALLEHCADSVVLVGGGAALDVGKAVAIKAHQPGDLFDYEDGPDVRSVDGLVPFMVALPTTAGTGSEVGRCAVIGDNTSKAKKIIFSPRMVPNLVLLDPELTIGLPSQVTAATGVDALTHCVEAYLARGYHPLCDGIAIEGVRMIARALPLVMDEPTHLQGRRDMLVASMMGAVAFQKGLGVTHSCAHALSTVYDTHHGLANALLIQACMDFNAEAEPERLGVLAEAVGQPKSAAHFVDWLGEIRTRVGLPSSLADLGIEGSDALLDAAVSDPCHTQNPRSVSREQFAKLYKAAGAL